MSVTQAEAVAELERANTALRQQLDEQRAEHDAALAREAALAEVLNIINSSPGELAPVFDAVLEKAHSLCDAAMGALVLYDGEHFRAVATHGIPEQHAALIRQPYSPNRHHLPLFRGERFIHVPDIRAGGTSDHEVFRNLVQNTGARTLLIVPLRKDGSLLGNITAYRLEVRPYSEGEIALLENFAAQAVIAMENARLLGELRQRTGDLQASLEYQTAIGDVLKVISRSTFDLQPVLETVARTAALLCDAEMSMVGYRAGDLWRPAANFGYPPEYEAYERSRGPMAVDADSLSVGWQAIREARVVHVADVATVPGYHAASVKLARQRTTLGVPMLRNGEVTGVIMLARQRVQPFTPQQIELVTTFADQGAIAIENTRLLTQQQDALERQTATAEVLEVINANPGNLTPVFDVILEKAHKLCGAAMGALVLYDGEHFRAVATHGIPEQHAALIRQPYPPNRHHLPLLRGERFIHLPDIRAVATSDHEVFRNLVQNTDARTHLIVPLRKHGSLLGSITAYRHEVRPYSDKEIALLENFAAQAVIAMENARLLTEQQEALERQTATAEVLQVINNSPGELAPVFDAMLEKALGLCGAAFGVLWTYDGERVHAAAVRGAPPAFAEFLTRTAHPLGADNAHSRLLSGDAVVHIADVKDDQAYQSGDPIRRTLVELGGGRTLLAVPLRKDDKFLGDFVIYRQEVRLFSDKQIALLQNFAAQAVIAMENARLLGELRARTGDLQESLEYQTATSEVLKVISGSTFDLDPVFETVAATAARLCHADQAAIYLDRNGEYRWASGYSQLPEYERIEREVTIRPGTGTLVGRVALEGRPIQIPDAWTDPLYEVKGDARVGDIHTLLGVPLLRGGSTIGVIGLGRQRVEQFTTRQIELVSTFADQAVIAIENTRLITEQKEALERQTATAEVLQVINASPGDLAPVFDAILEKAHSLCGATVGNLTIYQDGYFHALATHGFPEQVAAVMQHPLPPNAFTQELISGARFRQIADIRAIEVSPDHRVFRALVEYTDVRTVLIVPLRKDDTLLGLISANRTEVRLFTEKEIALLENFAAQAVIAMENARLLRELQEALDEQTATAEVLRVINASPGNLAPVFAAMIDKAARLTQSEFGVLATYDGSVFHAFSSEQSAPETLNPEPGSALGDLVDGAPFIHLPDVMDTDAYRARVPSRVRLVEGFGARTCLWIPMRKDDALLGVLASYRREVRPFSDRQIYLLQNFAAQAVIAMENARLLTEQREALERQTAIAEVLQVINGSPGKLEPVFDAILTKSMRLCDAAFGIFNAYDGASFRTVVMRGVPAPFAAFRAEHPPVPGPGTPFGRAFDTKRPVHVVDWLEEPAYKAGTQGGRAIADLGGARTVLNVPLVKDATVLGMISFYRQQVRPFSETHIALVENFAAQAVIAMENARLLDEIRQRQEELRITFENMGDGVAMFDETPRLVAWNRKFQELLDVPDEILAERQTYADYIRYLTERGEYGPGVDPEAQLRFFQQRAGEHYVFERTRPDGRIIEVRHNPVPAGGFVLIFADITERKRSEAELRAARDAAEQASRTIEAAYRDLKAAQANLIQAEKMASLGQLTAGIAHEIKNPLNFVNNFAILSVELLGELKETAAPALAALDDARRAEVDEVVGMLTSNLEKITEHGRRADGIVRSMLEHSRGGSGERRRVDLNTLAEEALNLAFHGARAQDQSFNITLRREFGDGIAPIDLVPQDVTRVLLNLFSNGFYAATRRALMQATPDYEPTLTVTTRDLGEAIEIRVHDNGIGIPAEVRDKLFQPFFTTKPTGEGTGLGLSISYDIVTQQHGGDITVDSRLGAYTEVTIRLPRGQGALR